MNENKVPSDSVLFSKFHDEEERDSSIFQQTIKKQDFHPYGQQQPLQMQYPTQEMVKYITWV